jgi:hypothetical protein
MLSAMAAQTTYHKLERDDKPDAGSEGHPDDHDWAATPANGLATAHKWGRLLFEIILVVIIVGLGLNMAFDNPTEASRGRNDPRVNCMCGKEPLLMTGADAFVVSWLHVQGVHE